MEIRPILSAMRRNKVGPLVIAVQMAITVGILCNALFIIQQRLAFSQRPSGADEANVFAINNERVGSPPDLAARTQADLAALRQLPGVVDATVSNSYVFGDSGSNEGVTLTAEQREPTAFSAEYYGDDPRTEAYKDDHGLAVILGVVCAALVAVTAFGIVGLTSYWVAQRRRQIGIRRALGATRSVIVRYFQTENLLIAGAGAVLGVLLAVSLNLWMVTSFQMQRLPLGYALIGAFLILSLGQVAVLWPALKAASIPPALATRAS
jgi:hypothetical protein